MLACRAAIWRFSASRAYALERGARLSGRWQAPGAIGVSIASSQSLTWPAHCMTSPLQARAGTRRRPYRRRSAKRAPSRPPRRSSHLTPSIRHIARAQRVLRSPLPLRERVASWIARNGILIQCFDQNTLGHGDRRQHLGKAKLTGDQRQVVFEGFDPIRPQCSIVRS
jgi:hypothetical protein